MLLEITLKNLEKIDSIKNINEASFFVLNIDVVLLRLV